MEAQFCLYRITSETMRYYHVASVLPPDAASELSDALSNPTGATPYQIFKTKVLDRFMPLECTRLQQLLTEKDFGDRRPSQLLRRMRRLLGERNIPTHSALLRELFLRRLSQSIRLVLAAACDVTLDHLSELADQVHEATSPSVTALTTSDPAISRLDARINELAASIAALRSLPPPCPGDTFTTYRSSHSFAHTSSSLLVPPAFRTPTHEVHAPCSWRGNAHRDH
nr:uncharacterized protein LOC126539800 [Dermacentor andersoni]